MIRPKRRSEYVQTEDTTLTQAAKEVVTIVEEEEPEEVFVDRAEMYEVRRWLKNLHIIKRDQITCDTNFTFKFW